MTSAFWKTIERIPDLATDTRDWRKHLAHCWTEAEPYLPETSKYAERIDCPWPGGEHCPRHVIRHRGGPVRAVCGDPGRLCDALDLKPKDIKVRELDQRRLFADAATALELVPTGELQPTFRIVHIGDHAIRAGRFFPVFVSLVGPRNCLARADVIELGRRNLPFVLLVASLKAIEADVISFVAAQRGRVLLLDECLGFAKAPRKGFSATMPPSRLFAPEIAMLADPGEISTQPVMALPVSVRWADLRFNFREEAVLNVSYRGQPTTRIEPDRLGMRDERNGKPNRQWRLLLACAALGGALPRSFPVGTIQGRRPCSGLIKILDEFKRGYDRQRQHLAAALKARFAIDEDPFAPRDDCYEARFIVDASGLRQGRADQRDRKFADDN